MGEEEEHWQKMRDLAGSVRSMTPFGRLSRWNLRGSERGPVKVGAPDIRDEGPRAI